MNIAFLKMHGAGNDFIVLDQREEVFNLTPALIRAMANRHCGVGCDQLVEIYPGMTGDIKLIFWNNDGSKAEACGNATRCVSAHIFAHDFDQIPRQKLLIETDFGVLTAISDEKGININMGHPQFDWRNIPLAYEDNVDALAIAGTPSTVSMGNPHCVFFVDDADAIAVDEEGAKIETHPLFPQKTNVEFISLIGDGRLRMRVWERGAGITLACGSGACAGLVTAIRRGLVARRATEIILDGGTLIIDWRDDGVWMRGPTVTVCKGYFEQDFLEKNR